MDFIHARTQDCDYAHITYPFLIRNICMPRAANGKYVVIQTKSKSEIRDKKDLYLLSLADTIKANYIVTGDKDLLVLEKHNRTKIVTITEFMKLL